jgi:hypothetical protein
MDIGEVGHDIQISRTNNADRQTETNFPPRMCEYRSEL